MRHQKRGGDSLRLRLTLLVSVEIVVCIVLALALYFLLQDVIDMDEKWLLLLDLVVVSLLVGSVVTLFISKYFFAPIKKLGKAMEQVADGDFSVRLDEKSSSKEIMEVYSGFNMMAHELRATEILQTDFVSNVSHEFKTPINAIEGYSMLLQDSENLSPEQQQYIDKIVFNTSRLSSLVGSILLLSKLENQQIPTGQTCYRLDEQIRQSIVAQEAAWEKKELEFDVNLDRVEYVGNEPMMRHVWDNLISNAIKFSPIGGLVCMRLRDQNGILEFTISDEGPGISDDALKHIFDKFYQADSSHKEEGNGLGMALVKRILAIEGGTVRAENRENNGARITVTLRKS
ncbi:MAG: HAMP domain-containing histidine kinase [Oscillospiraceae bacterium]|nr:HAMP domain-containing histidine kinase [Oscillospiraceae bacterium]